jgi:hypothetical protein
MSRRRKHWLAAVFILLAAVSAGALGLMAAGYLRVDSEWPGLLTGLVLLLILLAASRR